MSSPTNLLQAQKESEMAQRTVDVHNHFYPSEYLEYLVSRQGRWCRATQTGEHSYLLWAGDVIVAHIDRAGHYDMDARIRDLDRAGMDTQIISKTVPGPEMLEPKAGVYWAKRINDHFAEQKAKHPHRIFTMAALPYQVPDEACKELERCYKELDVKGIQMFSNCQNDVMFDPKFDGIFALANQYELPILMHPAVPLTAPAMDKARIPYQLYGYTVDTSLAVIGLIFNGVFEKHKNITMIHAHLGGIVPYLVRRLVDSWKGYAKEWGLSLSEHPEETYRKRVYPDTTSFYLPAMKCCLEWVGVEHLVIGTDYAHRVGDPEGAIGSVLGLGKEINMPQNQVDLILGVNAEKLFKLPPMPKEMVLGGQKRTQAA
jgi:aminocarboxymuconate-semialdehyde decarboxylase